MTGRYAGVSISWPEALCLVHKLKSVHVYLASAIIAITYELLGQFLCFLDQSDHHIP